MGVQICLSREGGKLVINQWHLVFLINSWSGFMSLALLINAHLLESE